MLFSPARCLPVWCLTCLVLPWPPLEAYPAASIFSAWAKSSDMFLCLSNLNGWLISGSRRFGVCICMFSNTKYFLFCLFFAMLTIYSGYESFLIEVVENFNLNVCFWFTKLLLSTHPTRLTDETDVKDNFILLPFDNFCRRKI